MDKYQGSGNRDHKNAKGGTDTAGDSRYIRIGKSTNQELDYCGIVCGSQEGGETKDKVPYCLPPQE